MKNALKARSALVTMFAAIGLVLATPAFADVTFDGDWSNFYSTLAPHGNGQWSNCAAPNCWAGVHAARPDAIQIVKDPTSPLQGLVAHITVKPGDKVDNWSGERAEVVDMRGQNNKKTLVVNDGSGEEFYAIAVKVASNWQPPEPDKSNGATWGTFLQLHGPDAFHAPPDLSIALTDHFSLGSLTGNIYRPGQPGKNRDGDYTEFSDGSLHAGHWVEFVLDVVWSYDNGSIKVYRRDEGAKNFKVVLDEKNIPTLQYAGTPSNSGDHYWKAGYYRSASNVTSELWLGPLVRGTNFNDVAMAAFGKPEP